jgi:leucyl-tRNA synthetase
MKELVIDSLIKINLGEPHTTYRLRDWLFTRQRYWGEPIPLLHCDDGKVESIVDTTDVQNIHLKLPLKLPEVPDYTPSSDGSSPLAKNREWIKTLSKNGLPALRETNTMPNWAGSSWYFLRYIDPNNDLEFADQKKLDYWLPVDRYFGGSEHTTLHLLYSRFWHRFFYDIGLVPTKEPYQWRINGGILLGEDGFKQSKSRGNVVDLNEMLDEFGADALRLYICFLGPYDATLPWNSGGLRACRRLLDTIWGLKDKVIKEPAPESILRKYHRTVKRVTDMIDNLRMNTVVSEFMILVNDLKKEPYISSEIWQGFIKLIAPFAVFLSEALWQECNSNNSDNWTRENSVHLQPWPSYNPELAKDTSFIVGVQINGKVRGEIEVAEDTTTEQAKSLALALESIAKYLEGKEIKKFIYVPKKIVSIVV